MSNQNGFDPQELLKLAQKMKASGEKEQKDTLSQLLSSSLSPEKRKQFDEIVSDKQAVERLMQSDAARQLMKKFGGEP